MLNQTGNARAEIEFYKTNIPILQNKLVIVMDIMCSIMVCVIKLSSRVGPESNWNSNIRTIADFLLTSDQEFSIKRLWQIGQKNSQQKYDFSYLEMFVKFLNDDEQKRYMWVAQQFKKFTYTSPHQGTQ